MKSRSPFTMLSPVVAAVLGLTLMAAPVDAQERPEQPTEEQMSQCELTLTPSEVTIPGQPTEEERRQQRVAANRTVMAHLRPETPRIERVRIERDSGIEVSLKKGHEMPQMEDVPVEENRQRKTVGLDLDLSEANPGEWTVTLIGQNDEECTATLKVREPMPPEALR